MSSMKLISDPLTNPFKQIAFTTALLAAFLWISLALQRQGRTFLGPPAPVTGQAMAMGVLNEIQIYGLNREISEPLIGKALNHLRMLDSKLSHYKSSSEISRINRLGFVKPQEVSRETFEIIRISLKFYGQTQGYLDITVLPLVKLWGIYQGDFRVPGHEDIAEVLRITGSDKLILDAASRRVGFRRKGMELDLGAIGKGYACDQIMELLKMEGADNILINIGGNICAAGNSPASKGWDVGIRDPLQGDEIFKSVVLHNESLATSGNYENYRIIDGKRYGHILNPKTGYPVEDVIAVSVIAPTGTLADALATGIFAMGPEKAPSFMKQYPGVKWHMIYQTGDPARKTIASMGHWPGDASTLSSNDLESSIDEMK